MSHRRSLLYNKGGGGILTPADLGAVVWFDGSDASKFSFTGLNVDSWESSIDSDDTIDYTAYVKGVRLEDALASTIGQKIRYTYTGVSNDFSGAFTVLWKAKQSIDGLTNAYVVLDAPTYIYVVTSGAERNRYRDSTGSGGSNSGVASSLDYVNCAIVGDGTDRILYENNVLINTETQGSGALETGGRVLNQTQALALSQTFLKQLIIFDKELNSTELEQMNDFLDTK